MEFLEVPNLYHFVNRKKYLITCFLLLNSLLGLKSFAQFQLQKRGNSETLSFTFRNNLIIIPLTINGEGPFNFVLDTGVGVLLITDPSLKDSLNLKSLRTITITGFGEGKDLDANITSPLAIVINSDIRASIPAAILKADVFGLSAYTGMPIHGLIGAEFFNSFIVKINYPLKTLKIYKPETLYIPKKGHPVDISIENGKPYVFTEIAADSGKVLKTKLIIDTGSGHPVWLESFGDEPIKVPARSINSNLGIGLSGAIDGKLARISYLKLGKYKLKNVVAAFPDFADAGAKVSVKRDGNLGNALLKKFDVVFDYSRGKMYLKPNHEFKQPFEHDMSGMELAFLPPDFKRLYVARISPGSAAEDCGLQVNDEILSINFKPINEMDIDDIYSLFRSREGAGILIQVLTYGTKRTEFVLMNLKRRI